MEYYSCTNTELTKEICRRGCLPYGDHDQLSEALKKDDDARASEATTVATIPRPFVPSEVHLMRSAEFGTTAHANVLIGEGECTCNLRVTSSNEHLRNRALDYEHILSDTTTLLQIKTLLYH